MIRSWLVLLLAVVLAACGDEGSGSGGSGSGGSGSGGSGSGGSGSSGGLEIAAAKVAYTSTGREEGTTTLWFQDHGATVVVELDLKRGRMEERKKIVWRDGRTTAHDYTSQKTQEYKIRQRITELTFIGGTDDAAIESQGFEKLGEATIAGQSCTHWRNKASKSEYWVHGNLVLKEQSGTGRGAITREATSFEKIDSIPPTAFATPQ